MIYHVLLPLLLTIMPWIAVRYVFTTVRSKQATYRESIKYLWPSAVLWVVGTILPNIPITSETKTFSLHVTGGVVAFILFCYVTKVYGLRFVGWWQRALALFFFVSGMGVTNELFELLLNKTGIEVIVVHPNDTWWDLTANTTGAACAYIVTLLLVRFRSSKKT